MGGDTFAVSSNVAQYSGHNVYWLMDNNRIKAKNPSLVSSKIELVSNELKIGAILFPQSECEINFEKDYKTIKLSLPSDEDQTFIEFSNVNDSEDDSEGEPKEKTSTKSKPDNQVEDDEGDKVDYKALYEKEKQLREKLQHSETVKNKDIKNSDDRSDFDVAIDFLNDF
jgi:hypothetical protein